MNTKDLLAELDAEFGKKKKGIAPSAGGKKLAEGIGKKSFQNPGADSTRALIAEANRIVMSPEFLAIWQPAARETWVTEQTCETCLRSVKYISGEYVRFRNPRLKATISRRSEVCTNLFHFQHDLPEELHEVMQTVLRCPCCIADEAKVSELWTTWGKELQQPKAKDDLFIPGIDGDFSK